MKTIFDFSESMVEVYRRILKYPPFALKRRPGAMYIKHNLETGYIEAVAPEFVTVEDAEKMFACLLGKVRHKDEKTVTTLCHIADVRKIVNCNDDKYIEQALKRVASMTISMHFESKKTIITHLIHRADLDYSTGIITLLWDSVFYDACKTKSLTMNLSLYSQLTPAAKNLYSFIISNSADEFTEGLLIERCVINASRRDKAQSMLKNALDTLVNMKVITSYSIAGRGESRKYKIARARRTVEFSTAGVKHSPQQV